MEAKNAQFYGAVTVSDRGQIVIPVQARRDLGIEVGEKLLVVSGPGGGLVLIRASLLGHVLNQWADVARHLTESGFLNVEEEVEEENEER